MTAHQDDSKCADSQIKARPASELLRKYTTIDWFFLDVEGAEMKVLKAWNWDAPPRVARWSIESNKLDRAGLVRYMLGRGYACAHLDAINSFCQLKSG